MKLMFDNFSDWLLSEKNGSWWQYALLRSTIGFLLTICVAFLIELYVEGLDCLDNIEFLTINFDELIRNMEKKIVIDVLFIPAYETLIFIGICRVLNFFIQEKVFTCLAAGLVAGLIHFYVKDYYALVTCISFTISAGAYFVWQKRKQAYLVCFSMHALHNLFALSLDEFVFI